MNGPKARLKLVQTEDGRWWVLAGWLETYDSQRGGTVTMTLQDGAELHTEVLTSLEFNAYYPRWPTYEFVLTGPVEEVDRSRNDLNVAGHHYGEQAPAPDPYMDYIMNRDRLLGR